MQLSACLAEVRVVVGQYEAEKIILHCIGINDRSYLFTHSQAMLSNDVLIMVRNIVRRRQESVPLAYLLGYCDFYDLRLSLNRYCLVPRPDTELLVDVTLECLHSIQELEGLKSAAAAKSKAETETRKTTLVNCLDLGTGSGAIILALKHQCAQLDAVALDICPKALAVARHNGAQLGLFVQWQLGDWAECIPADSFHCIVSNPPYVSYSELSYMNAETSAEPARALFSASKGLADYRIILHQAYVCLISGGWLCVEHGFQQAPALADLFSYFGYQEVQQLKDYAGHYRVTKGQKPFA